MKKYLFIATAAITVLAGCNKFSFTPDQGDGTIIDTDTTPVEVKIGAKTADVDVKTKAAVDTWANTGIQVIAYKKNTAALNGTEALFINEGATVNGGTVAFTDPINYGEDVYNFYGYHTGMADEPDQDIAAGTITVPITITGQEDVMLAAADPIEDVKKSDDLALNITNYQDYVYGATAARRKVHPNLVFEHQLTRFEFKVIDGSSEASNVTVTGISIKSVQNKGTLTVASLDATPRALVATPEALGDLSTGTVDIDVPISTGTAEKVGDIMMFPGAGKDNIDGDSAIDGYIFTMTTKIGETTGEISVPVKYVGTDTEFRKGVKYAVLIKVYSPEAVKVTATLVPWDEEEVTVDPDEIPAMTASFTLIDGTPVTVTDGVATAGIPTDGKYYTQDGCILTASTVGTETHVVLTGYATKCPVTYNNGTSDVTSTAFIYDDTVTEDDTIIYVVGATEQPGTATVTWTDSNNYTATIVNNVITDWAPAI